MLRPRLRATALLFTATLCFGDTLSDGHAFAQDSRSAFAQQDARSRMRPIGSPSAVDRYRQASAAQRRAPVARQQTASLQETGFYPRSQVRQVAMMQNEFVAPDLAPGTIPPGTIQPGTIPPGTIPPGTIPPGTIQPGTIQPGTIQPGTIPPGTLPSGDALIPLPGPNTSGVSRPLPRANPVASAPPASNSVPGNFSGGSLNSDLAQVPQPQLQNSGFATVDNCNCVSGPSGYTAACGYGCGSNLGFVAQTGAQVPVAPGFVAPQAQIPNPAAMPTFIQPSIGSRLGLGTGVGTGTAPRALISLGQQLNTVQVGQGLWGQPVAYVPGQSIRNWVRYFFP